MTVDTGKFTIQTAPDDAPTGCMALDVCGTTVLPGGLPCERDWECESGECLGIACPFVPTGFAFGAYRVCASAVCDGPNGSQLACAEDDVQLVTPGDGHCFCVPQDACDLASG